MRVDSASFQPLWHLLEYNRPVAVHSHLIGLTGSAKTAVFLSQLVYWTRRSPVAAGSAGWIHKTSAQWFGEIGLGRREQESAREALKALDVLEEALRGQPALRYYRLRLPQLGHLLSVRRGEPTPDLDLHTLCDETLVRDLLGKALPYHRTLAFLTGNLNAALLLTRVIYQHRRHLHAHGWFRLSRLELERDLGLTRWEQESARECLRGRRFVEERLAFVPPRLYARAVPPTILEALRALDAGLRRGMQEESMGRKSADQIVGIPAFRGEEKRHPNYWDSRQFGCTKTSFQLGGKPPFSLAENRISINRVTTRVNLTTEELTTTTGRAIESMPLACAPASVVVVSNEEPHFGLGTRVGDCLTVRQPLPARRDIDSGLAASVLIFPREFLLAAA